MHRKRESRGVPYLFGYLIIYTEWYDYWTSTQASLSVFSPISVRPNNPPDEHYPSVCCQPIWSWNPKKWNTCWSLPRGVSHAMVRCEDISTHLSYTETQKNEGETKTWNKRYRFIRLHKSNLCPHSHGSYNDCSGKDRCLREYYFRPTVLPHQNWTK